MPSLTAALPAPPMGARLPAAVFEAGHSDAALAELTAANRDLRIERQADGSLRIMPPTASDTGHVNFELTVTFGIWARADATGLGFDSSTGFRLPNGAVRSADLAWVRRERWEALTDTQRSTFAPLCPDFVLELKSATDTLKDVQDKLAEFIANGARLGWLIDPESRCVYVYRPDSAPEKLDQPTVVDGDPVLPGFVLPLNIIWAP